MVSRYLSFIVLLFLLSSCDNRPNGILSQTEMVDVLTDFHLLEGSLTVRNIKFSSPDTAALYYYSILDKHKITEAEFDSSLIWYTKNPKKFKKIYVSVLEKLTQKDEDVKMGKYHPNYLLEKTKTKSELWNKKANYHFTKDSVRTKLDFEIKDPNLLFGDMYTLKFYQKIAPKDSCDNRHVVLRINYANGLTDSVFTTTHNDDLTRKYMLRIFAKRKLKIQSITGSLLGSKNYKGDFAVRLDSISLLRNYNSLIQDSLRLIVNKPETKMVIQKPM